MKTTAEAARTVGITYRQIDHWITLGYIKLNDPSPGTGNPRHLSTAQFAILVRMAELVRAGIRPEVAAKYAKKLRREGRVTVGNLTITEGDAA